MKSVAKQKSTTSKTTTTPLKGSKNLFQFLQTHRIEKGDKTTKSTNTRIGSVEHEVYAGNYYIPPEDYNEFLQLYYREVFVRGQPEYLTEAQLEKGPLFVDVDLRHKYEVTTRQYTQEHMSDLVYTYLGVLKKVFQLDDEAVIEVFLFQKPTVNRVAEKQITKDGAHLLFTITCDHTAQQLIRKKVIADIGDVWGDDLNITNDWESVFDEGISKGTTNWQLFGSRKPGNEPYRLTGKYTAKFDASDEEFSVTYVDTIADASAFDIAKDIFKLSARYTEHYEPFMTSAFMAEYNDLKEACSGGGAIKRVASSKQNIQEMDPLTIRTKDQLDACLKSYLDNIPTEKYDEYEAYSYAMTLPPMYYENGSYERWIKVGWALKTISKNLFIVWLAFSAQSLSLIHI